LALSKRDKESIIMLHGALEDGYVGLMELTNKATGEDETFITVYIQNDRGGVTGFPVARFLSEKMVDNIWENYEQPAGGTVQPRAKPIGDIFANVVVGEPPKEDA
jgi:hypothetical protein